MPTYSAFESLLNDHNFAGTAGQPSIPGVTLSQDDDDNYIIHYTIFRSAADVASAGYYPPEFYPNLTSSIASSTSATYKQNAEDAFSYIMQGNFGSYSVLFQDVAKISFQAAQTGTTGEITVGQLTGAGFAADEGTSAFTYPYNASQENASSVYGDIWINTEHDSLPGVPGGFNVWDVNSTIQPGTAAFKVLLEEISHSLGIDILAPDGVTAKNAELNNHKYTVTSYVSHPDMDYDGVGAAYFLGDALGPFPKGLQLFDIAALQEIYGRQYDTRNTATTYSAATAFASNESDGSFVYTIWDGGGEDKIDAAAYSHAVQIDLRQGRFSSIGNDGANHAVAFDSGSYDAGNVAIAYHTIIENATGTNDQNVGDILIGNAWGNWLIGLEGNDTLYGDGLLYDATVGFTTVDSRDLDDPNRSLPDITQDNDKLNPGVGADHSYGGYGDDTFIAAGLVDGLEGDTYDGGGSIGGNRIDLALDGKDTVDYRELVYGIQVDLRNPMAGTAAKIGGGGVADTLVSIENLKLGSGNDTVLLSSPAGHQIDGGGGSNTVGYYTSAGYFDTVNGRVYDAAAKEFDTLTNVQNVTFNFNFAPPVFVIPDLQSNTLPTIYSLSGAVLDFSGASTASEMQGSAVLIDSSLVVTSSITVDGVIHDLHYGTIRGSNFGDTYDFTGTYAHFAGVSTIYTGTGDSTINVQFHNSPVHTIVYTGGNDTYYMNYATQEIVVLGEISIDSISLNYSGAQNAHAFDATIGTAKGTITLHYDDVYPYDRIVKFYDGTIHFTNNPSTQGQVVAIIDHESNFANTPYFTWGADSWTSAAGFTGNGGNIDALAGDDTLTVNSGTYALYGGIGNDHYVISQNSQVTIVDHEGQNTLNAADVDSTNYTLVITGDTLSLYHNDPILFATVEGISSFSSITFADGITLQVSDILHTPEAQKDIFTGNLEHSLAGNVLEDNGYGADSDPDGDAISVQAASFTTAHGAVVLNSNGTFVYTPDTGFLGADSFQYTLSDGQNSSIGTVSINVTLPAGGIVGTLGDDTLANDADHSALLGGLGNDQYILSQNFPAVITDHAGLNTIYLSDVASTDFSYDIDGSTINIYSSANLVATVEGIDTFSTITFSDGISVLGSDILNDTLTFYPVSYDGTTFNDANINLDPIAIHLTDAITTVYAANDGSVIWGGNSDSIYYVFGNNQIIHAGSGNDNFNSGPGNHMFDGGGGTFNVAEYGGAPAGIVADLSQHTVSDNGWGGSDTLINIQVVSGSGFNDQIAGSTGNDYLLGNAGNDTLTGNGGNDQYAGGRGGDAISAGSGNDIFSYFNFDGEDTIQDSGGFDTIILFGIEDGSLIFTRTADDLNVRFDFSDGINIHNFYSGNSSDVVEQIFFADSSSSFDLTTLLNANSPPVAHDDSFSASYGQNISGNVLADNGNGADSDPDNDTLSVVESSVTTTNGFTVSLAPTGGFIFAATPDFLGADSFTYTISDGHGHTDTATVTLNISAPAGAIVGTSGGDALNGTTGADTIFGLAGADVINADAGNDTIYGGAGNDSINAGDGNDLIVGGAGNDAIDGGAGKDTADYSAATSGVNVNLATGTASDGSGGTDTLTAIENVIGSAYADILIGNSAGNLLDGRAGNDTITGNNGADTLIGGAGNDALDGSNGVDTADYSAATSGIVLNLSTGIASNDGDGGSDTLANIENVTGSAYADNIIGNNGANTITGGAGDDVIDSAGGDDTIKSGAGNDTFNGGAGNDTVDYGAAVAGIVVNLSSGAASNDGDGGSDALSNIENVTGSSHNDTIIGDGNANVLNAGGGADTLSGGAGNDTLNGGGGTDTADYSAAAGGVTVNLATGTAGNDGDGGTDTLSSIENITGSAYGDSITGSTGNNVISTDGGADSVYAGAGNDTVRGGTGNDALYGEDGDDTLYGEADDDYLNGGAGNDVLVGGLGNDTMDGGSGTDTADFSAAVAGITVNLVAGTATGDGSDTLSNIENVTGSAFADTITGDSNANVLNGGDGNDLIAGGAGNDTIDGGNGSDTVDYSGAAAGVTVDLLAGTASDGFGGTDTLSHIEHVIGSAYADTITGNNISNILNGGAGNDTIAGSGANDTLIGGAGNDTLNGGGGTDVADYSAATSGIVVNLATGVASNDGYGGTDTISTIEWVTGSAYNDNITGTGGANTLNGGDGADTLSGGGGNDTLNGGAGNDSLDGGSGNDILFGGGGADYLTGGNGADSFIFQALTAMSASVTISDFRTSQSDKIDISDVLASHYNPVNDAIDNFVSLTTSGGNTLIKVDLDGTGNAYSPTQIASLQGVTGLNLHDLIDNGNLLVAA